MMTAPRAGILCPGRFAGHLLLIYVVGFLSIAVLPSAADVEPPAGRPNILIILADDIGYSDIGAYGGEIRTPTLDRLADAGTRFTQFYNTARCCPTRASLLTGLYPHQAGVGHLIYKTPHSGYGDHLTPDSITIAEILQENGYGTYMAGKWHLAPRSYDPDSDAEHWPTRRGFDKFYGTIAGSGSFFDPATLCRGETYITPENDPEYRPEEFYYTDAITDNAVAFLKEHIERDGEAPFFLYAAYTAPHWPLHAPEEEIEKYDGQYDAGYAAIHEQRVARLRELGLVPEVGGVAEPVGDWSEVENKDVETSLMETYAAMVTRMDRGIGEIVEFLRQSGQLDNTLIFYLQDNGGNAEDWFSGETEHERESYEPMGANELQTSYRPRQTRDGRPVRTGKGIKAGPADTYLAYRENWANVSNAPFRKYKHYVHEGGISTPLIVHWPERLAADAVDRIIREPAHLIDILRTSLDAAGVEPPTERKGVRLKPFAGVSLLPALEGRRPLERNEPLFWEHESNRAVREGKWKLVALEGEPWELYDMSRDRGEVNDLAANRPEVVTRLSAKWDAWAAANRVLPIGGWTDRGRNATNRDFRPGDTLAAEKSPLLQDKTVNLSVKIVKGPLRGVVLAQGAQDNGYTLYLDQGKLTLAMRRAGDLYLLEMESLPAAPFTIRAMISSGGRATLSIDDRRIETNFGEGFPENPDDGLSVGIDAGAPVGEYDSEFPFKGSLGFVTVRGEFPSSM